MFKQSQRPEYKGPLPSTQLCEIAPIVQWCLNRSKADSSCRFDTTCWYLKTFCQGLNVTFGCEKAGAVSLDMSALSVHVVFSFIQVQRCVFALALLQHSFYEPPAPLPHSHTHTLSHTPSSPCLSVLFRSYRLHWQLFVCRLPLLHPDALQSSDEGSVDVITCR